MGTQPVGSRRLRAIGRSILGLLVLGLVWSMAGEAHAQGESGGWFRRLFQWNGRGESEPTSYPQPQPIPNQPGYPIPETLPYGALEPPQPDLLDGRGAPVPTGVRRAQGERVESRPYTEADPLLSQVLIGRSEQGERFGTFLQVFEDGTVLDARGVHQVDPRALQPLAKAIEGVLDSWNLEHCGGVSHGMIDQIHVVLYQRGFGRLRARALSYSGNLDGCDTRIARLHRSIETFRAILEGRVPPNDRLEPTGSAIGTGAEEIWEPHRVPNAVAPPAPRLDAPRLPDPATPR